MDGDIRTYWCLNAHGKSGDDDILVKDIFSAILL